MPTAEINVPRNANVRMEPKLRKKLSYGQTGNFLVVHGRKDRQTYLLHLVARVQDDGWKEEVEEDRVLESLSQLSETAGSYNSATWQGFIPHPSLFHLLERHHWLAKDKKETRDILESKRRKKAGWP